MGVLISGRVDIIGRRGRGPAACIMALLLTTVLTISAAPSWGHSDLADSSPAQGAKLDDPPANIDLRFNEDISAQFAQVSLARDGGQPQQLQIRVRGPLLTASVPRATGALPGGRMPWTVAYRVVSADGHPITGTLEFTAPAAAPSSPTAEPTPPAPSGAAPPAKTEQARPLPQTQATEARNGAGEESGTSPWLVVLGILLALALLAMTGAGFLATRRRREWPQ